MPQMIVKDNEIIRICPVNSCKIEYSLTQGRTWFLRYTGSSCGNFQDLLVNGSEILATTSKGLYYSINNGRSWFLKSRLKK